ncbi:hypothetical protein D3C84_1100900 [compost metagenome]
MVCIKRPVDLVLMPGSMAAARFFEQGLIMVYANAVYAHQLRCNFAETCGQRKPAAVLALLPQIADLNEGFPVSIPFRYRLVMIIQFLYPICNNRLVFRNFFFCGNIL